MIVKSIINKFTSYLFNLISCKKSVKRPPLAPVQPVRDVYFGREIIDNYRYMENLRDKRVKNWLKKEADYAKLILKNIDSRRMFIDKMYEFDKRKTSTIRKLTITDNDKYFYLKITPKDESAKLYVRDGYKGSEILLFDPNRYGKFTKKYVIKDFMPSYDSKFVAFNISLNGEELCTILIINVEKRILLPEKIDHSLEITSWLKDNNSFLYLHSGSEDVFNNNFYLNAKTWIHRLNSNSTEDRIFFSKEKYPELRFESKDIPVARYDKNCDLIFGLALSVDARKKAFYTSANQLEQERIVWKKFCEKEDKIYEWLSNETDIYLYSPKCAPNFKLLKISKINPKIKQMETFIPEDPEHVLSQFTITKDGIYYTLKKRGINEKLYFKAFGDSISKELHLPFASGSIVLQNKSVNFSDIWITHSSWINESQRYRYDLSRNIFILENISGTSKYQEFEDLIVEELLLKSHDEITVPLTIIHKKGIKRDGNNRLLLFGYGAYGVSIEPVFSPNILTWCLEDGILGISHVRGGGELGDNWYKGGFKASKPNSWKDFIACAEYMIHKKYTSRNRISIWGASAGGIVAGRAMTERPELFGAVILESAALNTLRQELEPNGPLNIPEFGSTNNLEEFQSLLEMDSYHHLIKGIDYPPALITAGFNDSRVIIWNSAKFAALLRASNMNDKTILFRINFRSGHGLDNTKSTDFGLLAEILCFALWNTGDNNGRG